MAKMYRYAESGLPNVWLANGYSMHDSAHGRGVSIEDIEGLHRAIGLPGVNYLGRPMTSILAGRLGVLVSPS